MDGNEQKIENEREYHYIYFNEFHDISKEIKISISSEYEGANTLEKFDGKNPYESAYNNQCVECGYNKNPRHGMTFKEGRHISKKDTPIYCEKCGALLPRPTMLDLETGERRRIKGFDSAYRRMTWDAPAGTITRNVQEVASDKKIHPTQNRTLSIYEATILQTISDYKYKFSIGGQNISLNACCQVIGESVPPRLIEMICNNIKRIEEGFANEK